jgi:hypothetical protein
LLAASNGNPDRLFFIGFIGESGDFGIGGADFTAVCKGFLSFVQCFFSARLLPLQRAAGEESGEDLGEGFAIYYPV